MSEKIENPEVVVTEVGTVEVPKDLLEKPWSLEELEKDIFEKGIGMGGIAAFRLLKDTKADLEIAKEQTQQEYAEYKAKAEEQIADLQKKAYNLYLLADQRNTSMLNQVNGQPQQQFGLNDLVNIASKLSK